MIDSCLGQNEYCFIHENIFMEKNLILHQSLQQKKKSLLAYTSRMMKMFYFFMDEGRKIIKIHTVILTGKKAYFEFHSSNKIRVCLVMRKCKSCEKKMLIE